MLSNPERRQAVIEQICTAISKGTNYRIATDCFCTEPKGEWKFEFQQDFLSALCGKITEFTEEYTRNYNNVD